MTDRDIELSKPVTLTDPLAAATDQAVDDDGTVTIDVGDEYAWTRYLGPQPYLCPGDWVLATVEADGMGWQYYPEIGRPRGLTAAERKQAN